MVLLGPRRTKSRVILDRAIESKAYIKFYFYRSDESSPLVFTLPFLSNPSVEESQNAVWSKNRPIGRAGTIPVYLGAQDRQLRLSFELIYPHIEAEGKNLNLYSFQYNMTMRSKEEEKARFNSRDPVPTITEGSGKGGAYKLLQSWVHTKRHYLKIFNLEDLTNNQEVALNNKNNLQLFDLVTWWINLIRCSVVNNAERSLEPPPLIRLNFGILYNDIPCICDDFRIEAEESAGYDLKTFLPRKIRVRMDLREVRVGNFGKYYPGDELKDGFGGDNLAGWEAVIEHGTKDPYIDIMNGFK